jgi:DNA-binding protein H-NS
VLGRGPSATRAAGTDFATPGEYCYIDGFREIEMARTNLASMSVDELLKFRDDIGRALSRKAALLKDQLSRLGDEVGYKSRGRKSVLKGRKVAIKYRDKSGNTWAGRGAQPVWLREKLKAGAKLEDFSVHKTVASRKASPRKSKKRRRAKR